MGNQIVVDAVQLTHPENRSNPKPGDPAPSLAATSRPLAFQCHGSNVGPMGTLRAGNQGVTDGVPFTAATLTASSAKTVEQRPRRLTPREYERLQGLPDNHTRWRADGREIADGPRYRMVGNGAAVPVIEWIGRRIRQQLELP